jgi:hypothetical protein
MSEEEYLASKGASRSGMGEAALHKNKGNLSDKQWKKIVATQAEKDRKIIEKRDKLRKEYKEKVDKGEITPPTRIESLIRTAQGHEDNEATKAARRLLEKKGIDWKKQETLTEKEERKRKEREKYKKEKLQKAKKPVPVGTVSGKYKKIANGKWVRITEGKDSKKKPKNDKKTGDKVSKNDKKPKLDEKNKGKIRNALKKFANILAEALSGKDVVQPTGEAVEQAGESTKKKVKKEEKLQKARPTKYLSKKPDGKGGWIYKYKEEKKNNKIKEKKRFEYDYDTRKELVYKTDNSENVMNKFKNYTPSKEQDSLTRSHIGQDLSRDDISLYGYKIIPKNLLQGTEDKELFQENIDLSKKNIIEGDEIPIIAEWRPVSEKDQSLVLHILDGHHRLEAYIDLEIEDIPVAVVKSFNE